MAHLSKHRSFPETFKQRFSHESSNKNTACLLSYRTTNDMELYLQYFIKTLWIGGQLMIWVVAVYNNVSVKSVSNVIGQDGAAVGKTSHQTLLSVTEGLETVLDIMRKEGIVPLH